MRIGWPITIAGVATAVVCVAASGCGSGSSQTGGAATATSSAPASPAAVEAFRRRANGACIQAYDGKRPKPATSSSEGAVRTYAIRTLPVAERIEAGLRRLTPPAGPRGVQARAVAIGWSQLATTLRETAQGAQGQVPPPKALTNLQRDIAARALSIGIDACAPPVS